jgi:hypothetical protein
MDAAAAVAVVAVALALVVAAAVAGNRAGGLHLTVRLWWDRARDTTEPDPHGDTDDHGDTAP